MKQLHVFVIAILFANASLAQQFGVHAGVNFANASSDDFDVPGVEKGTLVGPILGVVADFSIADNFHFRPELNYLHKGFKRSYNEPGFGSASIKARLNYLELPLNFAYAIPAGKHKFLIGAGPSIGLGLSGKVKERYEEIGEPVEEDEYEISFGSNEDEDDLKSLDLGLNFFAAFQMQKGIFLKAGYSMGLSNLYYDSESRYKNKGVGITIGYMFKKKSK